MVRSVPQRGNKAAHHDRLPRAGALPRRRAPFQHGGVRLRLQVPRWSHDEPTEQVQSVVVASTTPLSLPTHRGDGPTSDANKPHCRHQASPHPHRRT